MRPLPARSLAMLPLLLALAACDDDPSGPDGSGLSREEVGGVYAVCTLSFQATGLRAVDVVASVADARTDPELRLGLQRDAFDFEYTAKNDVVRELLQGSYERAATMVSLNFPDGAGVSAILLPDPLRLDYADGVLSAAPTAVYRVPKAEYVALAGLSADEARNLQPQIEGTLTARFARGGCS